MNSTSRDRIIALAVAIGFHSLLLLSFCYTFLTWPPEDADDERLPEETGEILFVNEYINLGDMITNEQPADAPVAPSEGVELSDGNDLADAGKPATPAPLVTSKQSSPMKVREKPKPEKTGPTKEELEAREKARKEQISRDKIKNQMNFGGKGKGDGISGTGEGTGVSGTPQGSAGHDLAGRTILSWGGNSSRKSGIIKVAVTVNAAGKVTAASYAGGSGSAAGDTEIRNRTIQATRQTKFSVLPEGSAEQKGTITWRFK